MPVNGLIEFILYLVPGFFALEVYHSHFPIKEIGRFK